MLAALHQRTPSRARACLTPLQDGQRVELVGMDKFADIKAHIDRCCTRM